jgi:septal ring-binding cell division protein DamX/type II secretory pathway predicted ATPase ExeA
MLKRKGVAVETYISQQKKHLLDSLENQVLFSQLVAVVIGEKGIGKSFFLQQLQQRIETDVVIAKIDASLAITEDQLEKTISLQLGLDWQESETSLEQRIQNDLQQKVLITIDDAQLLSSSCLEFILQLNQNQLHMQESVLFILLAGDVSLPRMINETNIFQQYQEMCVVFQVEAIQQKETKAMLADFCAQKTQWVAELYEEKKLTYFWQLSKGNPAELNYHLSRWLEENQQTEIVEISRDEKNSYLRSVLYVLVVFGLISLLYFQDEVNNWVAEGNQIKSASEENTQVLEPSLSSDEHSVAKNKMIEKSIENQPEENSEQSNVSKPIVNVEQSESPTQPSLLAEPDSQIPPDNTEANTDNTIIKTQVDVNLNQPVDPPTPTKEQAADQPDIQVASNLTIDEQSLLKLDKKLYVLQWVGLSQLKAAENYKEKHPLANKMTTYRRANNEKILYLVISGQFISSMQADVAKAEYKQRGYNGKPWVKSITAVQKEIETFRDSAIR